jgi:hypothetical protein
VPEVLWPPDLAPSSQTWNILGNAASFVSPLTGSTRTYGRGGVRMGCTITLPPVNGQNRARMTALFAALKDRSNRILVPDFTTTPRGSFPYQELLTNSDFSNGTTGWTADVSTIAVSDRILRVTATSGGSASSLHQLPSMTSGVPYALRGYARMGTSAVTSNGPFLVDSASIGPGGAYNATDSALKTISMVASASGAGQAYPAVMAGGTYMSGDYMDVYFTSLARCMLSDGSPNLLLYSDQLNSAAFSHLSGATIVANNDASPDGTMTGDVIHEDSTTAAHFTGQSSTVASAAADYAFSVAIRQKGRTIAWIQMVEGTGSTSAIAWINLSTGVIGTATVGANWTNIRSFSVNLGNGWYGVTIVARKTNSATSLIARVGSAISDGSQSYTGTNQDSIACWRATLAQSSVPVKLTQTTSAATSGTTQTGVTLNVKGLPASTSGILKAGDMVEIAGQINILTAPLNSDAAGLGVLSVGNPFRSATNDAPIIVNTPMCKMLLSPDQLDIDTQPGRFSPFSLELVEAID